MNTKTKTDPLILQRIDKLAFTISRLEERLENLEDLLDLEHAVVENAGKPLVPWEGAKAGLD